LRPYLMSLMASCFILTACQENNPTIASADFAIVNSGALNWVPVPDGLGAKYAVVYGNPSQSGTYVIRVHFPAGIMDLPHSHSADRHVTVIKGKWRAGDAGSYMFHPAGGVHWDGATGNEETIVQIIGNGPVTTEQNHDKTLNWVRVN